ncbi:MAG TPA: DUF6496 domain-containing protein [Bryobacteraceae bacterium]
MPEKRTLRRARKDAEEGKAPTTQAGEFVREEMEHAKQGRHSSGNPKQAIAIGLSKARRAGVKLPPPKKGKASAATRKKAAADSARGRTAAKAVKKTARKTVKRKGTASRPKTAVKKKTAKKSIVRR